MSENPDNKDYQGLGPSWKPLDGDGNEMSMEGRFLATIPNMLRFISRDEHNVTGEFVRTVRILQQYTWSSQDSQFDWYDVPLVIDE